MSKVVWSFTLKPSPGAYSVPALYRCPERVRLESGQSSYGRNSGVPGCQQLGGVARHASRNGEPTLLSVPWRPASAGPVANLPLAKPPEFLSLSNAWMPLRGTSLPVGRLGPPHSDASTFDRGWPAAQTPCRVPVLTSRKGRQQPSPLPLHPAPLNPLPLKTDLVKGREAIFSIPTLPATLPAS